MHFKINQQQQQQQQQIDKKTQKLESAVLD